jgi:hypothetical protein
VVGVRVLRCAKPCRWRGKLCRSRILSGHIAHGWGKGVAGRSVAPPPAGSNVVEGPVVEGPNTEGPDTEGPDTEGPNTEGPDTEGPDTEGPDTEGDPPAVGEAVAATSSGSRTGSTFGTSDMRAVSPSAAMLIVARYPRPAVVEPASRVWVRPTTTGRVAPSGHSRPYGRAVTTVPEPGESAPLAGVVPAGDDAVPRAVAPNAVPNAVAPDAVPDAKPDAVPDAKPDAVPDAKPDAVPNAITTDAAGDAGASAVSPGPVAVGPGQDEQRDRGANDGSSVTTIADPCGAPEPAPSPPGDPRNGRSEAGPGGVASLDGRVAAGRATSLEPSTMPTPVPNPVVVTKARAVPPATSSPADRTATTTPRRRSTVTRALPPIRVGPVCRTLISPPSQDPGVAKANDARGPGTGGRAAAVSTTRITWPTRRPRHRRRRRRSARFGIPPRSRDQALPITYFRLTRLPRQPSWLRWGSLRSSIVAPDHSP